MQKDSNSSQSKPTKSRHVFSVHLPLSNYMLGMVTSHREGIVFLSIVSISVVNTNVKDHVLMEEESNCYRSF